MTKNVAATEESVKKDEKIFEKQTTTGRIVNSVLLPPSSRLSSAQVFENDIINTKLLRDHLKQEGRLTEECALRVIQDGKTTVTQYTLQIIYYTYDTYYCFYV